MIPLRRTLALVGLLGGALALVGPACSSTPKSGGKKRTVLMTSYDDADVGAEASVQVAAEMGLLDDADLDAYVSEIGRRLLRGVPRRPFDYQFKVVEQFEPNAFALPGGYIYVSRGLLALANDEDELANVIGHEITHAAQRHAAQQQALAGRINPIAMPWNRAALMASYSRDMEREADEGGQFLAAAAGYDPMGMSTFLTDLLQLERLQVGYTRQASFFDSHPGSSERAAADAARAHEIRWKRNPALGDTRKRFLEKIDGLPLGDRPQSGVFQGDRFLHPDLDFQIRFPDGWQLQNSNRAVGAIAPRGDAVVFLTADLPAGDPKEVAEGFVEKLGKEGQHVSVKDSRPVKIGRIDGWRMELQGATGGGSLTAQVTFIPYRGSTWRVMGVSLSRSADRFLGQMLNTARSFRPLTEEERRSITETRLRLVQARPGENLESLSRRAENSWNLPLTAVYNGIFVDHVFEGGEWVKTARVHPYVPSQP